MRGSKTETVEPKLEVVFSLRISADEETKINRLKKIQRLVLNDRLRTFLKRQLILCPICGETVGNCRMGCAARYEVE